MKRFFVMSIVLLFVGQIALAEDLQPPWWRGQPSTTLQYWEFLTLQPNPIAPDGPGPLDEGPPYTTGYLPSTQLSVYPGPGMDWSYDDPSDPLSPFKGIWPLSGEIHVTVDNHWEPREKKIVWIQITWRPQSETEKPLFRDFDPLPELEPQIVEEIDLGWPHDHWCHWRETTYMWEIYPNPPWEMFTIYGTIDVAEIVIDTWCIPEPATISLLMLGGLALVRIRRR